MKFVHLIYLIGMHQMMKNQYLNTPKNMLKLGGIEMGLATTGGTGAAIGQQIDERFFYEIGYVPPF